MTRAALFPLELVYRGAVSARSWLYDREILPVSLSAIPVVSVGNLSVGGTGKTPFAAWIAKELAALGARPAIVLRGYGSDEPLVHARLNPEIPVIVAARRAHGIAEAAHGGATVAVLDDAFQHRGAARAADFILIAAEQWTASLHLLPAGPWREPLTAIRRAQLAVITRKVAGRDVADRVSRAIARVAPKVPQATVRFTLSELRRAEQTRERETLPLSSIENRQVVAVGGIADPSAFFEQLAIIGARVIPLAFPDHHRYRQEDVSRILERASTGDNVIVCTLKDAVKLASIWPADAPPLWYVLQALTVETGADVLAHSLSQIVTQNLADKP